MKRIHARIYGFVQGVGYRHFVRKNANELGIKGWIRNNLDGTVQAIFEGDDGAVTEIIEKCKKGPAMSWVERVDIKEEDAKNDFEDFLILR